MTIMDAKFGAEVVTKKGRTYKFDDAICVRNFLRAGTIKGADIAQTVFTDYENNQQFTDAKTSFFVISPQLKSPMNGNAAAFASREQANKTAARIGGSITDWNVFMQANQQPQ